MSLDQARAGLLDVVEQLRIAKAKLEKVAEESQDSDAPGGGHVGSPSAERLIQGTADNLSEDLEETIEELERIVSVCGYTVTESHDRPLAALHS